MMIAVRSLRAVCERIAKMPELAVLLLADDFEIGDCGQQYRVPVDEALAAIDQAGFMQPDEMFDDRLRIRGVHRERFARPVDAGTHATDLAADRAGRKFFPFPDFFDDLLAAEAEEVRSDGQLEPAPEEIGRTACRESVGDDV